MREIVNRNLEGICMWILKKIQEILFHQEETIIKLVQIYWLDTFNLILFYSYKYVNLSLLKTPTIINFCFFFYFFILEFLYLNHTSRIYFKIIKLFFHIFFCTLQSNHSKEKNQTLKRIEMMEAINKTPYVTVLVNSVYIYSFIYFYFSNLSLFLIIMVYTVLVIFLFSFLLHLYFCFT